MSDITVEAVGSDERDILMQWLDSAAIENIDVTDVNSIDAAYERYFEAVMAQDVEERSDPTEYVGTVGFALGQWLANNSILEWRLITEDGTKDLGLSLPDESAVIFPSDRVAEAWNGQERRWLASWAAELKRQLDGLA